MLLVDLRDERQKWLLEQIYTGNENATTEFWAYIFKEMIFKGPDYSIAPEAPPSTDIGDRRKVDLVVKQWRPAEGRKPAKFAALLFFEAKKYKASQTEIDTLERQAYTASIAWLAENRGKAAYSMTVIGDSARLWSATIDSEYLSPLVPKGSELSDRDSYIKVNSDLAPALVEGFETMLRFPHGLPKSALASNATPPRQSEPFDYGDYDAAGGSGNVSSYGTGHSNSGNVGYGVEYQPYETAKTVVQTETVTQDLEMVDQSSSIDAASNDFQSATTSVATEPPELPSFAHYVDVEYKVDNHGGYVYEYKFEGAWRDAPLDQWERRTRTHNGDRGQCFLNIRKSGQHFWTWTLDPNQLQPIPSSKPKTRA